MIREFHKDEESNHNIECILHYTDENIYFAIYMCVFLIICLIIIKKLCIILHSYFRTLYEHFISFLFTHK